MKTIELSISDKNKSLLTHLQENGEFLPAYCAVEEPVENVRYNF